MSVVGRQVDDVTGLHALFALLDGEVHLALQEGDHDGLGRGVLGKLLTGVEGEDDGAQYVIVDDHAGGGGLIADGQGLVEAEAEEGLADESRCGGHGVPFVCLARCVRAVRLVSRFSA